ncbi:MAG: hypothetical protein QOF18_563 [Frankiaceae bacterium]|jgi:MFS family permease|nr:hypothetical protein [Frankiaceae bacterium]
MTDRWKRLAPLSGVVMVGLIVALLNVTANTPSTDTSGAKVLSYYSSHVGRQHAGIVLAAYAALFALVYFISVARYLRSRGADVLATTTVAGALLFAAGLTLAAGTSAILSDHVTSLSPASAQTLNLVQSNLWWPTMMVGLALATLGMGVSMLRTKAVPKALGIITVVVGVVAISGIGSWFAFLATGPLTLVIAGFVYQRLGRPESITLPDVPEQRATAEVTTQSAPEAAKR